MKKIFLLVSLLTVIFLTGCFETTEEITLNADGSGTLKSTNDMSAMVGLVKQMGGKDVDKMSGVEIDTSYSLASQVDSIDNLTAQEKETLKKGMVHLNVSLKDEKFVNTISFPFSKPSEITGLDALSAKTVESSLEREMGNNPDLGNAMKEAPEHSSIDDYYMMDFSNGVLIKSINKEKYAGLANDEYLKSLKEYSSMGLPATNTYIINLPRPAKKVEGKNVKVSDDRKKITVKTDIDDLFDDPAKLEFRVEY